MSEAIPLFLNSDYKRPIGQVTVNENGLVYFKIEYGVSKEFATHIRNNSLVEMSLSTASFGEPAVEAKENDNSVYRIWFNSIAGVYVILKYDQVFQNPYGQTLVFYRKIDADRKLEEIKILDGLEK